MVKSSYLVGWVLPPWNGASFERILCVSLTLPYDLMEKELKQNKGKAHSTG